MVELPPDLEPLRRQSRRAALVSGAGAVIMLGAIGFAALTIQVAETRLSELTAQQRRVQADIENLELRKNQAVAQLNSLSHATAAALGYAQGKTVPTETLIESARAEKLVQTAPVTGVRKAVTLTIYAKSFETDANQNILIPKLRNLGFTLQLAQGRGAIAHLPTNAVWFGRDVPVEDVRLVALTLMSAGITLRTIRPFSDPGRKTNAIEIGADAAFAAAPPLRLDEVSKAASFRR